MPIGNNRKPKLNNAFACCNLGDPFQLIFVLSAFCGELLEQIDIRLLCIQLEIFTINSCSN